MLDLKNEDGTIAPWTLILGNNGLGKTTLLKCIAWMSTVEESDKSLKELAGIDVEAIAVKPALDNLEEDEDYIHLARVGEKTIAQVSGVLAVGVPLKGRPAENQTIKYWTDVVTQNGELLDRKSKLVEVPHFVSPTIYAYSASRHMEQKNLDRSELSGTVWNLFSESGELFDASEQLLFQDYTALQESPPGRETALLNKIKSLLVELLPGLTNESDISIRAKDRSVTFKTVDGEISLEELSLGYKTMVAWTVDLALKMLANNPASDDPLSTPAVVIIDEVDLHLHPKWQRIIQQKLTDTFTKTQFICTAHSPFMAQSSETENLCVLKRIGNEVIIENDPFIVRGWRIGQIITSDLFGLPEMSSEVEDLFKERRELLDKSEKSDTDQSRLKVLDKEIDELPFAQSLQEQRLLESLKKTADYLNDQGKLK